MIGPVIAFLSVGYSVQDSTVVRLCQGMFHAYFYLSILRLATRVLSARTATLD
jgi:hypothetical protein